jgi:hypothetical protein
MFIYTAEDLNATHWRSTIVILALAALFSIYFATFDPLLTARIGVGIGFFLGFIGAMIETQTVYFAHPQARWTNLSQWTLGIVMMCFGIFLFISAMIAIGQVPREAF